MYLQGVIMRATFLLMLAASFIVGCSDSVIYKVSDAKPKIVIYPEMVDFGSLVSGLESEKEEIIIVNAGDEDLIISSPELFDGSSRFDIENSEDLIIPPSETYIVEISYTPQTYEQNGAFVRITSNDEDDPLIDVNIVGLGDAPIMSVSPTIFDYGDISIGCDNEERFTIRNDGNLDLTIESVTQMVTQPVDILMEYGSLPEPPWTLIPGEEVDFLVSYIPTDVGTDESQITVAGNDPYTPEVELSQYGNGDVEKWFSQTHNQEEIPVLDILWVVDNSGSMNPHQTNLSLNIGSFMSAFVATGADYNMAVITTDDYRFSTIVTPWSTDPEGQLASLVVTGVMGHGMEKGLKMAESSLSHAAYAGPGGNFFRSSAKLVLIFVSDEPDHSGSWSSYLSFFDALKTPGNFIPYGVIGDPPGGCTNQSGHGGAQYGRGYWDIINHYGGSWYSICASDWGVQLQDLADEVAGRRMFVLEEGDPIVDTIEVSVNGQVSPHWEYDEDTNSVVFAEGHVPEEGQTIDIDYAVWGCDDGS
mgnify:CR=1 FL=1|tara:strand:- start:3673 stop:5265 length:1593 start_codon:yes stop_codon:yes gene_type:complete